MFKTTLIKSVKYLLSSINIVKKNDGDKNECKYVTKNRNKIVKILTKLKYQDLPIFRSKNLSKFKKVQTSSNTRELNFLIPNTKVIFIQLT